MGKGHWTAVLLVILCTPVQADVEFSDCGEDEDDEDRYGEVVRGQVRNFTCSGIGSNQTVTWKLGEYEIGVCPPVSVGGHSDTCDTSKGAFGSLKFLPHRWTGEGSVVTLSETTSLTLRNAEAMLRCETEDSGAICPIDIVKPARGECRADFVTSAWPWSVRVHCDVTGGWSSRRRYGCRLFHSVQQQESEVRGQEEWRPVTGWGPLRRNTPWTSVCDLTTRLNTKVDGRHRYTVKLRPGHRMADATFVDGENLTRRPSVPSIVGCNYGDVVPENRTLTCQCKTSSLGRPKGRLVWVRQGVDGRFDTSRPLEVGQRGRKTLKMTTSALTHQADRIQLRCDVIWAENVTGEMKDVIVGDPASAVAFSVSGGRSVKESGMVTFTCSASGGRPSSHNVTVSRAEGGVPVAESTPSPLRHSQVVWCEDSGKYRCVATNGVDNGVEATAELNVTCAPRDISGDARLVNIKGGEEAGEASFAFDVVANPVPYHFSFFFLGTSPSNPASSVRGVSLTGECRRKGARVHSATCTVTVGNVTSAAAVGLYRGSVRNQRGSLPFIFRVIVNGSGSSDGQTPVTEDVLLIMAVGIPSVIVVVAGLLALNVFQCMLLRRRLSPTAERPTPHGLVSRRDARRGNRDVATVDTKEARSEGRALPEARRASNASDTGPYDVVRTSDMD
ncbi:uncharacterized protein LOC143288191 isoform X2 [Babylonia areolata]|uniref:uncharacterized protein LOC143288191 isoform X2 n=1 Tax=Babylonia areolata TaxID=304850 RepID=UPI003FD49C3E